MCFRLSYIVFHSHPIIKFLPFDSSSAPYALPFDRIPDYGICINLGLDRMSILATMAVGQIFVRFDIISNNKKLPRRWQYYDINASREGEHFFLHEQTQLIYLKVH